MPGVASGRFASTGQRRRAQSCSCTRAARRMRMHQLHRARTSSDGLADVVTDAAEDRAPRNRAIRFDLGDENVLVVAAGDSRVIGSCRGGGQGMMRRW